MDMTLERERLVTENLNLVHYVISKYVDRAALAMQSYLDYEDLEQNGRIGLIKAAKTYDESKGAEFSTYAYIIIRNELLSSIRTPKKRNGEVSSFDGEIEPVSCEIGFENLEIEMMVAKIFEKMEADGVKEIDLKKSMFLMLYGGSSQTEAVKALGITKKKGELVMKSLRAYLSEIRKDF